MPRKERITQNDFSFGCARPEAIERDDTELITAGLWEAENTIVLTTGQLEVRSGTLHVGATAAREGTDIDLGSGRVFDLHILPDGVRLYRPDGTEEVSFTGNDWASVSGVFGSPSFEDIDFWVVPDPDTSAIIIGAKQVPLHALTVDDAGVWSFGLFSFAQTLAGATRLPYFQYYTGVAVTPSGRAGSITLTASEGIWLDSHQGLRVRFWSREIVLGARISATEINATVIEELPPTYNIIVASGAGYQVGQAVEDDTLGGKGIITQVGGNSIRVLATNTWNGFAANSKLVAPDASSVISAVSNTTPAGSEVWDMQMFSPVNGYPGWATKHKGRLYLCGFPKAAQAYAASSAGFIDDFTQGERDADGFVESIGVDSGGDLRYIISAEDLLFLTSKGLYYQQSRGGQAITPRTIAPIRFSPIGAAFVRPTPVDEGAIFVDAVGGHVYAANLSGDQYRSWRADNIGAFHSHLIKNPVQIGVQINEVNNPETFVYVVNSDGSAAVGQWNRGTNKVGLRPWSTAGKFKAIYSAFGKSFAIVDREINGAPKRYYERFETGLFMDCCAVIEVDEANPEGISGTPFYGGTTAFAEHLDGHVATVFFENWDLGDRVIGSNGKAQAPSGQAIQYPAYDGFAQVGLQFPMILTPWPRRSVATQRGRREVKRLVKIGFVLQDTLAFDYDGEAAGGYRVGEDMTKPPSLRSEEFEFVPGGRASFEKRSLTLPRPGPFRLLRINYKVTI